MRYQSAHATQKEIFPSTKKPQSQNNTTINYNKLVARVLFPFEPGSVK